MIANVSTHGNQFQGLGCALVTSRGGGGGGGGGNIWGSFAHRICANRAHPSVI